MDENGKGEEVEEENGQEEEEEVEEVVEEEQIEPVEPELTLRYCHNATTCSCLKLKREDIILKIHNIR